jgi:hypothetical protein
MPIKISGAPTDPLAGRVSFGMISVSAISRISPFTGTRQTDQMRQTRLYGAKLLRFRPRDSG